MSRYESGRVPDVRVAARLAAALHVSLDWLLNEAGAVKGMEAVAGQIAEPERGYQLRLKDPLLLELIRLVETIYESRDEGVLKALRQNLEVFLRALGRMPPRSKKRPPSSI